MLYLLDANVLITANNLYYEMERVPEFWDWLIHKGETGEIKLVQEIYEEITGGNDGLAEWIRSESATKALLHSESVDIELVRTVTKDGYGDSLTDEEMERVGRDPFLVAHALADAESRIVVTTEVSKPSRQGANRHIPDICNDFGISCCDTFALTRALDFRTNWST